MVKLRYLERNHCKFIEGEPCGEHTEYCGRECVPTTSWCIHHLRSITPRAETIIKRELMKWEAFVRGEKTEPRIAGSVSDEESEMEDDEKTEELV